jgi:hypothetical protein
MPSVFKSRGLVPALTSRNDVETLPGLDDELVPPEAVFGKSSLPKLVFGALTSPDGVETLPGLEDELVLPEEVFVETPLSKLVFGALT